MQMDRLQKLLEFHKNDNNDPFIIYAIGLEHDKKGSLTDAITWFEKLYESHPDYMGLYLTVGMLYEKSDQHDLALRMYKEGLVLAKNIGDFHAASELNTAKTNLELTMDGLV